MKTQSKITLAIIVILTATCVVIFSYFVRPQLFSTNKNDSSVKTTVNQPIEKINENVGGATSPEQPQPKTTTIDANTPKTPPQNNNSIPDRQSLQFVPVELSATMDYDARIADATWQLEKTNTLFTNPEPHGVCDEEEKNYLKATQLFVEILTEYINALQQAKVGTITEQKLVETFNDTNSAGFIRGSLYQDYWICLQQKNK